MSTQLGDYEIHALHDTLTHDPAPWVAVRHVPCGQFVSDPCGRDGFDMICVDVVLEFIQNHVCDSSDLERAVSDG